jgi:hypothetical protein
MIKLSDVKEFLNIDYDDNDRYLLSLIDAVKFRARTVIGDFLNTPELDNAMLNDVAAMYQNRGDGETGSEASLATYRRMSKRPMF